MRKIRERKLLKEIRTLMQREGLLKFLELNGIKSQAASWVLADKIDIDFYQKVFCKPTPTSEHWSKVNYDYIMNAKI